jgi:hypothetical protein
MVQFFSNKKLLPGYRIAEGIVYTKWGANGLLNTEAVAACLSVALFFMAKVLIGKQKAPYKEPSLSQT